MSPGFKRNELQHRYNVRTFHEDEWHAYSGHRTLQYLTQHLHNRASNSRWLLNAGAGVYEFGLSTWNEVCLDLFTTPICARQHALCASIERLPLKSSTMGAVICVGEVLGYSDPAAALAEFARVLSKSGILICDFGSSRGIRNWFTKSYGRAADLIIVDYNRTPERTWIYDPRYIDSLLHSFGFQIRIKLGTHTWSALAKRLRLSTRTALSLQRNLEGLWFPPVWADVMTIVALKT